MLKNSSTSWGAASRAFHTIGILLILILLGHGWWMVEFAPRDTRFAHYGWHASFGYALLFFLVLRLVWRWTNAVPDAPPGSQRWEIVLAHIGHWGLYALMLVTTLLGWGLAGTFRTPLDAKLFGVIPMPAIVTSSERAMHERLEESHEVFAWILAALVLVHILAALYHQFVKKDGLLRRMFL